MSTDTFRRQYRQLSDEEKATLDDLKACAEVLEAKINALRASREQSVAKTKLEEAVMWATKALT